MYKLIEIRDIYGLLRTPISAVRDIYGLLRTPIPAVRDIYGLLRTPISAVRDIYGLLRTPISAVRDIYGLLRFALAILRTFGIRTIVLLPHVRYICKVTRHLVQARCFVTLQPIPAVRDIYGLLRFALAILRTFGIRTIVLLPHVRYICKVTRHLVQARCFVTLQMNIAHILSGASKPNRSMPVSSTLSVIDRSAI